MSIGRLVVALLFACTFGVSDSHAESGEERDLRARAKELEAQLEDKAVGEKLSKLLFEVKSRLG